MYKEVNIGETVVPMRSSALTAQIYMAVFNKDLLKQFTMIRETKEISFIRELAFVMAWQAKDHANIIQDMKKLSKDDFYAWLDRFSEKDLLGTKFNLEIENIWLDNNSTNVEAKN